LLETWFLLMDGGSLVGGEGPAIVLWRLRSCDDAYKVRIFITPCGLIQPIDLALCASLFFLLAPGLLENFPRTFRLCYFCSF